ncbi:ABC transporter substrate-binding protein [Dongia mobilis]|uniref:ABC transporter substrate-binding protein n=1 Tax=Dongia sp. TaxID=1977262 RepID=UPI0026ED2948
MTIGATRRDLFLGGLALSVIWPLASQPARADSAPASNEAALAAARGQTVYFNAWGGDQRINDYIAWAGAEVASRFGVTLQHVKLSDTAEAVTRVLAGKIAGQMDGGGIDLIWINGENFAAMKKQELLFGPIIQLLPNMHYVDPVSKPTVLSDFAIATDGYESPWGMAQLVFFHDTKRLVHPLRTLPDLLAWAKANPGRFTYPAPPDFIGSTILKQFLLSLATDRTPLDVALDAVRFDEVTAPLWDYLGSLTPHLWRQGRSYPASSTALRQMLNDGEIDISMAFNPGDASSAIAQGLLPDSVRSFVLSGGSIGNTHFVAIPFNANAKAGAVVVADFLLSPLAQARKQNADIWGDPTVLELSLLTGEDRKLFAALPQGVATLSPQELGPVLPEPHPSWMEAIEARWLQLYGH